MTKEEKSKEKKLLLNVLKDGLPHGLKLQITDADGFTFNGELRVLSKGWCRLNITEPVKKAQIKNPTIPLNFIYIKPYLRPMSNMTNDEKETYESFIIGIAKDETGAWELTDWLNKNKFDYRGLIPMGFALPALEDMYKIK